ncbi:LSU ribosomal protein L18P [Chthonomonas calidirosea]|uniref:50S ribosomal protein L18 n=1 Tax=Chthonomonas calidirosea TaxID=454171 RepID=UPI0006DD3FC1|nr:50S ribosomal protein L18 [Chthonomonas calidirosea]CEK15551.1 LSU ribosomal protein L18P [Chthonomonas calidirosea]
MRPDLKESLRKRRHRRVRAKIFGTPERPRLNVSRSLQHIYAQLIDDTLGHTLVCASTVDKALRSTLKTGGNVEAAKAVGKLLAERAQQKGITSVVFDRGGYKYHGRVRALAEAAREGGLRF